MLPFKLANLKSALENDLFLTEDEKISLHLLRILDNDPQVQKIIKEQTSQILTKSFAVASNICPACGKSL